MDLLSPAESQAFKSFLSSIDYTDALPAPEWGMYASSVGEDLHLEDVQGKEALTKATKDLMSLDSGSYLHYSTHNHHYQPQHYNHHSQQFQSGNGGGNGNHHPYDEQRHRQQQQQHHHHHLQQQQQQQTTHASTRHDSFPFLHSSKPSHHPHQHDQRLPQRHSYSHPSPHIPPLHTLNPPTDMIPSSSSSSSGSSNYSNTTPTSPHPSYARPSSRAQTLHSQLLPAPPSSAPPMQVQIRAASPRAQGKRPSEGSIKPPTSSMSVNGNDAKRRKPSPTSASAAPGSSAKMPNKPALLSPSQKKANHIQSEQKRRANIRRGYEALCEIVPALREAIREEEMAAGQEKKGKKRKKGKGDRNDEEGKFNSLGIDGRAGPRSENVVLAKTIDYITTLLAERSSLLTRLHAARSSLPPGHGALIRQQEPLWEREWKGGEGHLEGEDGDEDEEDEDGE